jgi:DNA-binding transcriptional LysR family regulator
VLVAEYISRGELKLILNDFVVPGPPMSLVYPSAGHQSPKVRVFSDFAAELIRRYREIVRSWIDPTPPPERGEA